MPIIICFAGVIKKKISKEAAKKEKEKMRESKKEEMKKICTHTYIHIALITKKKKIPREISKVSNIYLYLFCVEEISHSPTYYYRFTICHVVHSVILNRELRDARKIIFVSILNNLLLREL